MDDKVSEMYKISDAIMNFITNAMENLRVELRAGDQIIDVGKIWNSMKVHSLHCSSLLQ